MVALARKVRADQHSVTGRKASSEGTTATDASSISCGDDTESQNLVPVAVASTPSPAMSASSEGKSNQAVGTRSVSLSATNASIPLTTGASCEGRSKSCSGIASEPRRSSESSKVLRSSLKTDRRSLEQSVHSTGLSRHRGGRNCPRFAGDDALSKDGTASSGLDKSADAEADISSLGVSFHSIEVRQYARELGDNPSVTLGPPVSIGWDYDESTHSITPLDEYEEIRAPVRRSQKEFLMPPSVREKLVRESGHSQKEIASAVRQIEKDKRSRRRTVHNLKLMKFDETLEAAGRKLKRAVLGKKKDKVLYDDWKHRKEMAEAMIREENEASAAALGVDGVEGEAVQSAKAAALSIDEEQALWGTVSTKAEGTTKSLLTSRLPGKAPTIAIEEDSTHRGMRY